MCIPAPSSELDTYQSPPGNSNWMPFIFHPTTTMPSSISSLDPTSSSSSSNTSSTLTANPSSPHPIIYSPADVVTFSVETNGSVPHSGSSRRRVVSVPHQRLGRTPSRPIPEVVPSTGLQTLPENEDFVYIQPGQAQNNADHHRHYFEAPTQYHSGHSRVQRSINGSTRGEGVHPASGVSRRYASIFSPYSHTSRLNHHHHRLRWSVSSLSHFEPSPIRVYHTTQNTPNHRWVPAEGASQSTSLSSTSSPPTLPSSSDSTTDYASTASTTSSIATPSPSSSTTTTTTSTTNVSLDRYLMDHGLDNNSNGSPYHHHHHHQQPPPQQQQSAQEDEGLLVDGPFYAQDVLVRMMHVAQQQQRQLQGHHNRLQQQALQRQQLYHSQTYDTGATQQREQAEILSLLKDYCNGDGCEDWAKTGPSTLAFDKLLEHLDKNGDGLEDQDHVLLCGISSSVPFQYTGLRAGSRSLSSVIARFTARWRTTELSSRTEGDRSRDPSTIEEYALQALTTMYYEQQTELEGRGGRGEQGGWRNGSEDSRTTGDRPREDQTTEEGRRGGEGIEIGRETPAAGLSSGSSRVSPNSATERWAIRGSQPPSVSAGLQLLPPRSFLESEGEEGTSVLLR